MSDLILGNIDKRQLHLRWSVPLTFKRYTGDGFVADWRRLCNPRRWWQTIFSRHSYRCDVGYESGVNRRCYCAGGSWFDANIHVAGFVFQVFYSRYTGDVPCDCDRVLAELEQESKEPTDGA